MLDFDLNIIYGLENHSFGNFVIQRIEHQKGISDELRQFYNCYDQFREYFYRLVTKTGEVLMTNDPFEVATNQYFFDNAKGDVLIFGLGFGWIIFSILDNPNITSITVVEIETGIIQYVGQKVKEKDLNNKVTIYQGDVENWYQTDENKYDFIYFDSYPDPQSSISDKPVKEPLYSNLLNPGGESYFWCWDIKDII